MADGITAVSSAFPAPASPRAGTAAPAGATPAAKGQGTGQATAGTQPGDSLKLSPEAQREVAKLQARDTAVRAHEAAHIAAGGNLIRSGASFTYEHGPDGREYAVGGEVSIDTSAVPNNPQATITKAAQIEAAALAPVDPSAQDEAVAAEAAAMSAQASDQLATQTGKGPAGVSGQTPTGAATAGSAGVPTAGATPAATAGGPAANGAPTPPSGQAVPAIARQGGQVRGYGAGAEPQTGTNFSAYA